MGQDLRRWNGHAVLVHGHFGAVVPRPRSTMSCAMASLRSVRATSQKQVQATSKPRVQPRRMAKQVRARTRAKETKTADEDRKKKRWKRTGTAAC